MSDMMCFLLSIKSLVLLGCFYFNAAATADYIDSFQPERSSANPYASNDSLIFASVLFRHGDCNINEVYPNDPYKDEQLHWPEGFGQLTKVGKQQQYQLGQYFRRRYDKLLGQRYSPNKVYIQSTDVDRAIMSAQANLAGLYMPTADEIWNEIFLWHPVPVHMIPQNMDTVLFVGKDCPRFKFLFAKYANESNEIAQIYAENVELFAYWSKMCGSPIKTIDEVYKLYKTLHIESVHNKTLSDWAMKAIEPNGIMEYIVGFYHKMYADSIPMARIESGQLIAEIYKHFAQKINGTLQRSAYFYSAHGITVSFLLHSLGLFKMHYPPYACSVHFELYKSKQNEYYIQIFYRKALEEHPMPMDIPKCGTRCPLDRFYDLYQAIMVDDFDAECKVTN